MLLLELIPFPKLLHQKKSGIKLKQWREREREREREYPDWYIGCIEHLCSFNGRGFIGGYGAASGNRDYYQERKRNIEKQVKNFQGITFLVEDINDLVCENCVVYIDPPYDHTEKYDSLIGNPFDYEKFWNTVRRLSQNNIVYVSEETAPEDFECVWSMQTQRRINGNKKITTEALFKFIE